jgi:metallo-beta-lactamase class B
MIKKEGMFVHGGREIIKKTCLFSLVILIIISNFVACTNKSSALKDKAVEESCFKSGEGDLNYVELQKVKDNIWVHTTYSNYKGTRTPSNGVVAVTSKGLILVDTPWNNSQMKELIELTKRVFKKDIDLAIITHAHEDRIGGIDELIKNNIEVRCTKMTADEAEKEGYTRPKVEIEPEAEIVLGDMSVHLFYPGEGHTSDNITVWFPQDKILFCGCLIKSMDSKEIGNVEDGNVQEWPVSINKLLKRYADAKIVIPGHGIWGGLELINHTLDLLKN